MYFFVDARICNMLLKLCFVLCALVSLGFAREIPEYIHLCKRSDPHVAKCVRESVEALRSRLKNGIPELGVPSLEPLHVNEVVIARGDGPSHFRAALKNIVVHGAGDFKIKKIKLNVEKNTYRVGIDLPSLKLDGDYDVDARVLVVPIKGNGKFHADVFDAEGQAVLKAEVFQVGDHREIRFTSFDFAIKIGDYKLHLDNLFEGDEILSKATNEVLNQNKGELIQAALPTIQQKTSEVLLEAANQITKDIDYDKIFPEN